jgi:hypothetical protein
MLVSRLSSPGYAELDSVVATVASLWARAVASDIAAKFGFTYEGTLRKRNLERGRRVDLLIWGLLKEEWETLRAE